MKTADSPDLRGLFIAEPVDAPRTRTDAYLVRLSLVSYLRGLTRV